MLSTSLNKIKNSFLPFFYMVSAKSLENLVKGLSCFKWTSQSGGTSIKRHIAFVNENYNTLMHSAKLEDDNKHYYNATDKLSNEKWVCYLLHTTKPNTQENYVQSTKNMSNIILFHYLLYQQKKHLLNPKVTQELYWYLKIILEYYIHCTVTI